MLVTIDQVTNHSFDYIVIGGGTAGLVVAARLSEDPSVSVLVLEAGSPNLNDPTILTTARYGTHFGDPQYDWGFTTVPQTNANGKIAFWPRGKGLGGSSGINFFQFHLPSKADIDAFEKLGNKGWNWETLRPYFKKAERFLPPDVVKDDVTSFDVQEHGLEGPLEVAYPILPSGLEKPFVEAAKALGINSVPEPFAGNTLGIWMTPVTIRPASRTRSYAANMYYEPNASRSNLSVLTSAHVARISLSKGSDGATAESVIFIHDSKEYQALVNKKVVLSAGTILSPQVLELSGIGDPDVLRKADVGVVVDLPGVGNNIQEHVNSAVSYKVKEEFEESYVTFDCLMNPDGLQEQTELYHAGESTTFDMAINLMSFAPLSTITPEARALQDKYLASIRARIDSGDCPPGLRKQYEVQLEHIKAQIPSCEFLLVQARSVMRLVQNTPGKYIAIGCLLNHPLSRGSIHIKSNDPLEQPAIDPHYFEEEYDIRSLAETFKFCRLLVQQEPLKSILVEGELFPGPSVQTDEQIIENLKNNVATTFHTVGSCSMLPREDGGVVDNKLKVYGTTNVHVIDLSIIPLHIGAHTQATVYAIGELGADIIKGRVNF